MDNLITHRVSAIISNEENLELIITELLAKTVARHDINIQGTPSQLTDKYGIPYLDPEVIQDSNNPPKQDYFLQDDFAWVEGFSFSIPLFIGLVIGVFIIGDIHSLFDNIVYGLSGAIIGAAIGYLIVTKIKQRHDKTIQLQENRGGFVLWVTASSPEREQEIIDILQQHQVTDIKVTEVKKVG